MRLLCPFCQKAITVPDSEAGKAVNCPECQQQFAAPQLFSLSTSPAPEPAALPPAPPSSVPETYLPADSISRTAEPAKLPEMPPPDREMSGFAHMVSLPLEPKVIRWIPAGALFLTLILTLLPWNGFYPGGYAAYTQNAWQALFAWMSRDQVADDEFKVRTKDGERKLKDLLDERLKSSWWLLPYLVLLFPTLALAFAGPIVDALKLKMPQGVEAAWQFRPLVLGVLCTVVLLLLLAQWASGFGLQRAMDARIEESWAEKKAQANTPEKMQRWEMQVALEKGALHVKTTPWLKLSVMLHLLATIAVAAEAGLMLRGNKPPPRIGAMW